MHGEVGVSNARTSGRVALCPPPLFLLLSLLHFQDDFVVVKYLKSYWTSVKETFPGCIIGKKIISSGLLMGHLNCIPSQS